MTYPGSGAQPLDYATPYGPQSPRPGRNLTPLIASIVAVLLVGGGVTAYFLLKGDDKSKSKAAATSQSSSAAGTPGFPSTQPGGLDFPSASSFPTDVSTESGNEITEADARKVIVRYVNDINAQNRADAATVICPEVLDTWRASIDQPNGDFTVTVARATFVGSESVPFGLDVKYELVVKAISSGATATADVTFTVIQESGLKICGEK